MSENVDGDQAAHAATEPAAPAPAGADAASGPAQVEVTLRRAPKVGRFIALGLLLGGVVSFVLAIASAGWSALTTTNTFWLTLLWTGPLGIALGALAALWLDRRSVKKIGQAASGEESPR